MQGNAEKEGSSFMPGKEDTEAERVVSESQAVEIPFEQPKVLPIEPKNHDPTAVEENAPARCLEEEIVPEIEDEVQIAPPSVPSQQSSTFVKTHLDSP